MRSTQVGVKHLLSDEEYFYDKIVQRHSSYRKDLQSVVHTLVCEHMVQDHETIHMWAVHEDNASRGKHEKVEIIVTHFGEKSFSYTTSLDWAVTIYMMASWRKVRAA